MNHINYPIPSKAKYFMPWEANKMTKKELLLQASLGLQSCKTKKDAIDIMNDIWNIAQKRKKCDKK